MEAPLTPSRGRGEISMPHPRCARLIFPHSELGQDAGAQSVPYRRAVSNVQREVFGTFKVSPG